MRRFIASSAIVLAVAAVAPAQAAGPLEKNFWLPGSGYDGRLPACEAALPRISHQFTKTQAEFWALKPVIVGFERVRETAYSKWALGSIPRRYCEAVALVQDPRYPKVPYRKHKVVYRIGEDTGFAGFSWGVTWCVNGYDWNWAYNPSCDILRQ